MMKKTPFLMLASILIAPVLFMCNDASAVPAFARKYHTACSTCHLAFPVRNGFGEAFRNNGYRFPDNTDEEMVKEEPIKLGSDSYKNVFPDAIWPSDLPNMPTLGFLAQVGATIPKDKLAHKYKNSEINEELTVFFAGTVTNQISYIGDFGIASNNEPTTLGRLQLIWTFKPGIALAFGTVGFPEQFDLISARSGSDADGMAAQMPNPNKGVELRLVGNLGTSGGYSLLAGVGRNSQTDPGAPEAPTDHPGGNFADTKFARATLKIGGNGLLSGVGGELGNRAIGMDNSVTFGVNYYNSSKGGNTNAGDYVYGLTKTAYSGDVKISYGNFRAIAQYARFNDITDFMTGENFGKRTALSLEGDYWIYPWLFGVVRYEHMKDNLNGEYTKVIPGIGALLRPNFKVGVEYVAVTRNTFEFDPIGLDNRPTSSWNLYTQLGF
jgi:hypothetical protein